MNKTHFSLTLKWKILDFIDKLYNFDYSSLKISNKSEKKLEKRVVHIKHDSYLKCLFYQIKEIDIDLSSFTCLQINRGGKRPTTNLIFLASCKKNRYFCIQICSWFLLLLKNLMEICYFLTPQWQHQQQNFIFCLPKSPFLTFFSTFNGMAFFSTFNVAQIIPFECMSYSLNQFHCGIEAIKAFVTKLAYRRLARCAVVFQLRLHLQPNLSHRPY